MSYNSITDRTWQQRRRAFIDTAARYTIGMGGISVIFAIVLIFFYLLWVVAPIFNSAEVVKQAEYQIAASDKVITRYLSVEESGSLAARITSNGDILFFNLADGKEVLKESLDLPEYSSISHVIEMDSEGRQLAIALDNNRLLFVALQYQVTFVDDVRHLIPGVSFPFGEEPLELNYISNIAHLDVIRDEERLVLSALDSSGQLLIQSYEVEDGDELLEPEAETVIEVSQNVDFMLMDPLGEWLYFANTDGQIVYFDISDLESVERIDQMMLVESGRKLVNLEMLLGGVSLIAADDKGRVQQWSLQRDDKNQYRLKEVRSFQTGAAVKNIVPEKRRKAIVGLNEKNEIILYHTTADRLMLEEPLAGYNSTPVYFSLSSRADILLIESSNHTFYTYHIKNEHPELSWQSLWGEVMYEGYNKPQYSWQSSSADNDFEPKFSLMPLAFGTLKAAFYAMLIAMPLAIMGAIYTAYFMAPKMRSWVKPSIEIMEALPTVILGFLAGIWFAPIVENNLLAILSLSFVFPSGLLIFAWLWSFLPKVIRRLVPDGWQAALLVPVIIALVWMSFEVAPFFEHVLFGGDLKIWMKSEFGIGYDQRNSLVVGIAMGLAVIPTIFSITEDAIFSVPKHLTTGSLALGATPWQTLTRVVLLTASPGIFSAVMIGLGRAVGETMIVLMATGNTPVMDMSVFQGMRTLSANISVELPESEVDSSHYRILFLAALVLFIVTFMFNTVAEVIRQRLRKRYGSL